MKHSLVIAAFLAGTGWLFNTASVAVADEATLETKLVDQFITLFGNHPGFRVNHAKGIVAEGVFKGSPQAAKFSKAALFTGDTIPVTIRFSDPTGIPTIPDGSPKAIPNGLAIKYHFKDGSETDMVLNSLKFFPVATAQDFLQLLQAIGASQPDSQKPTALERFVATHPSVPAANATIATPASYATQHYFGINAFIFVNAEGKKQAVRYQAIPEQLEHLTPEEAAKRPDNFLSDDLRHRLEKNPVVFHLKAQLAAKEDQTKDPSKPWPDDREVIDLGTLTIQKVVQDNETAQKSLLFLPGQVTDGIEISDDPMIGIRDGAYAISFSHRAQ
ncbi:catalase family peroxidase [Beijerinckia mobilis]|uniref:catalase family peroxidase n=1 Tax=Beijerinckia mobilis TaxID=231434 RepID=UPI0005544368|nr:catalase family peroxidase [Beijerinckia mobilis]